MGLNGLHPITEDLLSCIQRNAINDGEPHYGRFEAWCISAEELESAVRKLVEMKRIAQGENSKNIVLW